jgi:uroporphyrinogen-III decarboxylase
MNAWQRVMGTLAGTPTDRTPTIAVLSAYGAKLTQVELPSLFQNSALYVAGQEAAQEILGLDMVMTPFEYSAMAEAFGAEIAWFSHQPPNVKRPAARSVEQALGIAAPSHLRTERLAVSLEAARLLHQRYAEQVPIFTPIPSPAGLCVLILGMEGWLEGLLFDSANALLLMERVAPFLLELANAHLEAGVNGIILTEAMTPAEILPRNLLETLILPSLSSFMGQIRGPIVFSSTGGSIGHVLDLVPTLPGVAGVSLGSRDDLKMARETLGASMLLLGNIDNVAFPGHSPEAMFERCMTTLNQSAGKGPFILSNSGGDIPLATKPETLLAMKEACMAHANCQHLPG